MFLNRRQQATSTCVNGVATLAKMVLRMRGSVVPLAAKVAVPAALFAVCLKLSERLVPVMGESYEYFRIRDGAYASLSGVLGLLVVFRSSQAYTHYWNGGCLVQQMLGSWFDCASSVIAFTRSSKAPPDQVTDFHNKVVKMFSLLTGLCFARLEASSEESSHKIESIADLDARVRSLPLTENSDFDDATLAKLRDAPMKTELVFHWIQSMLVDAIDTGIVSVPPPIASRAFQELGIGMVKFEDCMKICILPIPFPYSQTTVVLLMIHWLLSPFTMCSSTRSVILAGVYTFTCVFTFWSLFFISMELENPFGVDEDDLDVLAIQENMNLRLMSLLTPAAAEKPALLRVEEDDHQDGLKRGQSSTLGLVVDNNFTFLHEELLGGLEGVAVSEESVPWPLDSLQRQLSEGCRDGAKKPRQRKRSKTLPSLASGDRLASGSSLEVEAASTCTMPLLGSRLEPLEMVQVDASGGVPQPEADCLQGLRPESSKEPLLPKTEGVSPSGSKSSRRDIQLPIRTEPTPPGRAACNGEVRSPGRILRARSHSLGEELPSPLDSAKAGGMEGI